MQSTRRSLVRQMKLTYALRAHLIPSRNEHWAAFKLHLAKPEYIERRALPRGEKRIDLFTDGSCWNAELPELCQLVLGRWYVLRQIDG